MVLVLLGKHNFGHLGHRAGRHSYEGGGGGRVIPDPVDGAQLEGAPGFGGVLVDATHQPAKPAQRHPDRTTDQPGAYNGRPAHPAGRQRRRPVLLQGRPGPDLLIRDRAEPVLLGEVIAQPPSTLEIDVVKLLSGGFDVHHDPDTTGLCALDVELTGAQEGHVAKPDGPGGSGREHRVHVVGGREQHGNNVGVLDAIAGQHGFQQLLRPVGDLGRAVLVDGGGPAESADPQPVAGAGALIRVIGPASIGPASIGPVSTGAGMAVASASGLWAGWAGIRDG